MSLFFSLLLNAFIFITHAAIVTDFGQEERKIRRRFSDGGTSNHLQHQPSLQPGGKSAHSHSLLLAAQFGTLLKQVQQDDVSPRQHKSAFSKLVGEGKSGNSPVVSIQESASEGLEGQVSPNDGQLPRDHALGATGRMAPRPQSHRRSRPSISFLEDPVAYTATERPGRDSFSSSATGTEPNTRRGTVASV